MQKELIAPEGHRGGAVSGTQAVKAGNLIFVGGQMSLDEQGNIVGTDITAQARGAFEALRRVVEAAGATMDDVVKHNVYFSCDGDEQAVTKFLNDLDEVRLTYFSDPGPTATETRVGLDRPHALILIDAWVVVNAKKERLMPAGHWSWNKKLPFTHGWKVGSMVSRSAGKGGWSGGH